MLLEGSLSRTGISDIETFLDQLVQTGQDQVQRFEIPASFDDGDL